MHGQKKRRFGAPPRFGGSQDRIISAAIPLIESWFAVLSVVPRGVNPSHTAPPGRCLGGCGDWYAGGWGHPPLRGIGFRQTQVVGAGVLTGPQHQSVGAGYWPAQDPAPKFLGGKILSILSSPLDTVIVYRYNIARKSCERAPFRPFVSHMKERNARI